MDLPYIFKADVILNPELDLDEFIQQVTSKLLDFLQKFMEQI
jgi:hypothetical protein